MDPIPTLQALRAKLENHHEKAEKILDGSTLFSRYGQMKIELVRATEELNRNLEKARKYAQNGNLSEEARQSFRARREALLNRTREKVQQTREKITQTYGVDSLPPEPVSEAAHRRLSLLVAQLDRMDDEELAEHVAEAALEDDRATTQSLAPEVRRRLKDSRFEELPAAHPLSVAKAALGVSESNHQTVAAELARERTESLESQLDTVVRTIEDRGSWSGPAATSFDGDGRRASTRDLPVVGSAELAAYRAHGDPEREAKVEEATKGLPEGDPILNGDLEDLPSQSDRIRGRIENPTTVQ